MKRKPTRPAGGAAAEVQNAVLPTLLPGPSAPLRNCRKGGAAANDAEAGAGRRPRKAAATKAKGQSGDGAGRRPEEAARR
eukprot:2534367-Alexandrium_andersonii.AAC.1